MPSSAKKKLRDAVKSLRQSKTFIGIFSHLHKFVIKAKKFSFILVCKFSFVAFYVTRKTFEIFDPGNFLKTMKNLKNNILRKLASFSQNKEIICNSKFKEVCPKIFATFIKLRDSGISFISAVKKLL